MTEHDTNTGPAIRRVRRVGNQLHITYTNGRRLDVPAAVNGPYTSKVSYGYAAGRLDTQPQAVAR